MEKCLWVGFGGFIGAAARYLLSTAFSAWEHDFPIVTFLINLAGAVAIGFLAGLAAGLPLPPGLLLFLKTGVCGGFTTFSTFSLETADLWGRGKAVTAVAYALCSVILCVGGVFLGKMLSGRILPNQ